MNIGEEKGEERILIEKNGKWIVGRIEWKNEREENEKEVEFGRKEIEKIGWESLEESMENIIEIEKNEEKRSVIEGFRWRKGIEGLKN